MVKGQSKMFIISKELELQRHPTSNNSLQISSTKPIIVRAINSKDRSIQTSLLKASDKLGTLYKIPPIPSNIAEQLLSPSDIPERAPFTVIVINTGAENTVQWKGGDYQKVSLTPFKLVQFWMSNVDAAYEVEASEPVSVLFGHPCATIFNCTCGMLLTPLDPVINTKLNFFIPPDFTTDGKDEAVLLVADKDRPLLYDPDHPRVKSVGSVVFHRPGLLLSIIPEEDFAACFLINEDLSYNNNILHSKSYAVVVVHKDHKDLVHYRSEPLSSPDWKDIKTTNYVSTSVKLLYRKNVFWHPKAMMAVYLMGSTKTQLFGNPAPIISKHTNLKGCVIIPEVVVMGDALMDWQESIQYCREQDMELASMNGPKLRHLAPKIHAKNKTVKEVWIGFRRSSLTGNWYWLSPEDKGVETHWAKGEPGESEEGQCAMMSLDPDKDFGWSDESCCTAAVPLCYKFPILFPLW
ncbi:unnamed protein product [Merluccius merluccius]